MSTLKDLLANINYNVKGRYPADLELAGLCLDSRQAKMGWLFAALPGSQVDGHDYIEQALANGCSAVLCERWPKKIAAKVCYIKVEKVADALGPLAANFYEQPSQQLALVGVTGTNGKTSTVSLLYRLFKKLGHKVGLISTIENRIDDEVLKSTHTTPNAIELQALLAQMRDAACDYVFMEVSSHAAEQGRIAGAHFTGGVFSNISHDHLDYHKTFKNYIFAKKRFFDQLPSSAFALVNADDKRAEVMLQNCSAKAYRYAQKQLADFRFRLLENSLSGLQLELDGQEFHCSLVGDFNAYNLLAVYATAILLEEPKTEVLRILSSLKPPAGRFEYVRMPNNPLQAIVDYAHTPDALEKVLQTLKATTSTGRIITVVGCGGNRDHSKRPIMAQKAATYSDLLILSSDNPRFEEPEAILDEMWAGLSKAQQAQTYRQVNRREAIRWACQLAQAEDVILVAGKGHETYQEIKGERLPFDDREELRQALEEQLTKFV